MRRFALVFFSLVFFFFSFSITVYASETDDLPTFDTSISGSNFAQPSFDNLDYTYGQTSLYDYINGTSSYVFNDYIYFDLSDFKSGNYSISASYTVVSEFELFTGYTATGSDITWHMYYGTDSIAVTDASSVGLTYSIQLLNSQFSNQSTTNNWRKGTITYNVTVSGDVAANSDRIGFLQITHSIVNDFDLFGHGAATNKPDPGNMRRNVLTITPISENISLASTSSSVVGAIDKVDDTLNKQRQEEIDKGDQASGDASGAVDTLTSDIQSKWQILWYPITFTSNLLDVFVNGTSGASTYSSRYGGISGYTYDPDTGLLIPVRSKTRDVSSGTVITFPSYTLPVLNVTLWDEYSYDISTLRDDFPAIFSALDVVITVLEVMWLIGFLRDKYLEVFAK